MRFSQLLLLVVATFVVCCSPVTTAEDAVQINNQAIESTHELSTASRHNLKGAKSVADTDADSEERAITTPSFAQFTGALKLPKFSGFSKLPVIKQANAIRKKFGKKIADRYIQRMKKRYEDNPQNHI
uniref:RxLR effector protein n=1 Tax=Phytophthora sojae TaxID=67593 RepID=G1FSH3_PHYSO|nr:Avh261 [Phytophthora sojae]